jgi:hypothetical protein
MNSGSITSDLRVLVSWWSTQLRLDQRKLALRLRVPHSSFAGSQSRMTNHGASRRLNPQRALEVGAIGFA